MRVVYGYRTTDRIGKTTVPAYDLFDGPDEDAAWIGRLVANTDAELDSLFNRLENAVELN